MTPKAHQARLQEFKELLDAPKIDLKRLKALSFNGVPDEHGHRALCWRLLLNYLPPERAQWDSILERKRKLYQQFIEEMIVSPGEGEMEAQSDHPLCVNPDSQWQTYFRDNEVLLQIDKDVRRLCPDISFFQQASEFPCQSVVYSSGRKRLHRRVQLSVLNSANVERKHLGILKHNLLIKKAQEDYVPLEEGSEAHWEVVERLLFLYAKLNPGQGYVQGMNEIIGPIYYTFACDPSTQWREHAEADCFFVFTNLMGEIRDFFIKSLDEAECGINRLMNKLISQLQHQDHAVYELLRRQELCPQYYSFRWLTLMLSQEFPLPDVLRIWDSLFADEDRFSFLIHVCCAMIMLIRNQLLNNDFPNNVKILQNFPLSDISVVLSKAAELSAKLGNVFR
ncbi:unnamed protein product [Bemisia tabaci]|uniref:TBC1 domain family member 13 n=1 Tax=Bemisia tabaci TaxID=7038 RepID=A0A9P0F445_BEMTA|nr:PREDICTED: TBC1 domain family member 13 [Bemisia tabaci]CAH0391162.1 unnamed protein product [Bemisia tabaci]